jgi:hypothetical protein
MTDNKSMAKSAREYIETKIIKTHKKIINIYA